MTKVAVLSGHSDPKSLGNYIDLAFDELGIWDTSERVLSMRSKLEGAYRQIQTFRNGLAGNKLSRKELLGQVDTLLGGLLSSIEQGQL
ncbi:MAG: hypothetical protein QNK24_01270 [Desulfuromusa sp.]|nr:hypothetical protein [Desulfuromusa sp.]